MSTTTTEPGKRIDQPAQAAAYKRAGLTAEQIDSLTAEQQHRAQEAPKGLTGKALVTYILEGKSSREQTAEARATRDQEAKATAQAKRQASGPREGSAMHAAIAVLKTAKGPLTAQEIYERASKRKLLGSLKGKTPVATIAAQMAVHAKAGRYFERTAPGRYQLREGVK